MAKLISSAAHSASHLAIRSALAAACIAMLTACASLEHRAQTALADPDLAGTRWGFVVATMDGRELLAIRPDDRFIPASNTKLFTTAAAFHRLAPFDQADPALGASLRLIPRESGPPDLVIVGGGDPRLTDSEDCETDCLAALAGMVAQNGVAAIHDIIGDDRLFPDERWGSGWSWNNLVTRSGTAVSALTINDNVAAIEVSPNQTAGAPAIAAWRQGDDLQPLINDAVTVATGETDLRVDRLPTANALRLYGRIVLGDKQQTVPVAVDDPALSAAQRLMRLLQRQGVAVEGAARARHRAPGLSDDPKARGEAPPPLLAIEGQEIGRLVPPSLADDIRITNKISQNLYAELIVRQLGLIAGSGSTADGQAVIDAMLTEAGVARAGYELTDGSGMSTYNRISPRQMVRLLRWSTTQPWGEAWRATFPIGGVDGSLIRRFTGTPLQGRIFAKTGSLSGVNALAGFMTAASGRTLIFAIYANDVPWSVETATPAMDAALVAIAAAN